MTYRLALLNVFSLKYNRFMEVPRVIFLLQDYTYSFSTTRVSQSENPVEDSVTPHFVSYCLLC